VIGGESSGDDHVDPTCRVVRRWNHSDLTECPLKPLCNKPFTGTSKRSLHVKRFVTYLLVGGAAQWQERRSWSANFPCRTLDLQLMGDHLCG